MRKLLIADSVEEFRVALAARARGHYRVRVCQDGNEALQEMLSFKPDLVVLDLMLPGLDGISILQEAREAGIKPRVLAVSKYFNDYMAEASYRLDVGFVMVKPCQMKAVLARLSDLAQRLDPASAARPDPRDTVSNILQELGLSTKLDGYGYLREAILENLRCPGQMITKELYPKVGKLCDATVIQVERSIRSAISKAWAKRDEIVWKSYFRCNPDGTLDKPTNAVFISVIAERMRLNPP